MAIASTRTVRRVLVFSFTWGLWATHVLLFALVVYLDWELGDIACELGQGTSIYGEAEWSWSYLDNACTWRVQLEGRMRTINEPASGRLGSASVLLFWGLTLALLTWQRRLALYRPAVALKTKDGSPDRSAQI